METELWVEPPDPVLEAVAALYHGGEAVLGRYGHGVGGSPASGYEAQCPGDAAERPGPWKLATDYHIRYENTPHPRREKYQPDPGSSPSVTDRDGCDGFFESGGGVQNIVTVVTAVTGSGVKCQGGIPVGGDCRKAIQPEPLDIWAHGGHLPGGGKAVPFHLPNGEWKSLGGVQGALFKGRPCWGRQPQLPRGKAPAPPSESPRHFRTNGGESVIVGYYTSRRKCLPRTPVHFQQPNI